MSLFMDLDADWLLSGSQLIADYDPYSNTTYTSWEGYDAPVSTQINGYVTVHSPTTVFDAADCSMEVDSVIVSKSPIVEVEQFCPEMLPGSPEMKHLSELQLQQYILQLEMVANETPYATNISSVTSPVTTIKQQIIDWKDFQSISPVALGHEVMTSSEQAVATVPECESEDVIDLLNQLSDRDGDMYIDLVDLEKFVSFPLDPVSPDDIESLISSQLSAVDTQVAKTASSSFHEANFTASTVSLSCLASATEMSMAAKTWNVPVVEKKRKKQDQNKSAALRYRQKKRQESGTVINECEELERRNIELKTKVSEMTKEIDYLKGLIDEICAA